MDYEIIVQRFADSLYTFCMAEAEADACEDGLIDHGWTGDGGNGLTAPQALVEQVRELMEREFGKDAILADCAAFMAKSNEDEAEYGWYLQAENMGHGVGLFDWGYNTTLKKYVTEGVDAWIEEENGNFMFNIYGTGISFAEEYEP